MLDGCFGDIVPWGYKRLKDKGSWAAYYSCAALEGEKQPRPWLLDIANGLGSLGHGRCLIMRNFSETLIRILKAAWEKAHQLLNLLHKHGELSSNPQNLKKGRYSPNHTPTTPVLLEETEGLTGFAGHQSCSRLSERIYLKGIWQRVIECDHPSVVSVCQHGCIYSHIYATCTYTLQFSWTLKNLAFLYCHMLEEAGSDWGRQGATQFCTWSMAFPDNTILWTFSTQYIFWKFALHDTWSHVTVTLVANLHADTMLVQSAALVLSSGLESWPCHGPPLTLRCTAAVSNSENETTEVPVPPKEKNTCKVLRTRSYT